MAGRGYGPRVSANVRKFLSLEIFCGFAALFEGGNVDGMPSMPHFVSSVLPESLQLPLIDTPGQPAAQQLFSGSGEIRSIGRDLDWTQTPLGSVASWPQSLRSTVRTLLSSQYPMVLTWGGEFTQIYNDAYSKLIGDRHPAGLGTDIRITLAEAWGTLGPMIERVMATGDANWTPALPLEMHRSGYREEAYFSVSHAPAEDDAGVITGMLAVCSEVTEQIVGERRLKLLRELAARAGSAVQTRQAALDIMAALADDPLDIPYAALLLRTATRHEVAASFGLAPDILSQMGEGGDPWGLSAALSGSSFVIDAANTHVSAHGGAYLDPVVSAICLPVLGEQNAVDGLLVCAISPNRALDEAYRSFFELVGGQVSVAIRNAEAREHEQRRAAEMAELDRAKTAFFSNVSHEFRTPLTLILGPLEEALSDEPTSMPAHRDALELAHRNALRMLRLVNTLLDFSRVEASRMTAAPEPVDLTALTVDLASNFRAAIEKAGLDFRVAASPLSRHARVDREMYEKIVLNLVSNAFKFTNEGSIEVRLSETDNAAVLTVSDTGAGIATHELDNIFVRFHRIAGQKSRSHEGSGIGLALVKQLVELQGGTIVAESAGEGRGAAFTVKLPLAQPGTGSAPVGSVELETTSARASAYVEEARRWLPEQAPLLPEPAPHRPRILLADDNADMRAYVRRLLAPDFNVTVASDGAQALALARETRPDLVLSDIMMPHLDGFGLLRALRDDPATQTIPVIFLSAKAGEDARIESLEAGADDHLVKPFSALELRARIGGALDLAELRGEKAARERLSRAREQTDLAQAAQWRSEQHLQALTDALPVLISHVDCDLRYRFVNRAYEGWLGRPIDEILGARVEDMIGSDALAHVQKHIDAALAGAEVQFETFMPYSGIRPRHIRVDYIPQRGPNGSIEGFYGLVQDISERKLAERHRELLVDELNHRVKNTLAVVQSIAAQSFKGDREPAEARAAFEGRLLALSDAHNLLTQESWDYAMLADVIANAIHPFGGGRFDVAGPAIALEPKAAVSIALALHELCTNAAKYGALSTAKGRVSASWSLEEGPDPKFHLAWEERDGPPVAPRSRQGFGSRLIERGLAAELGGTAEMSFAPAGLKCFITAPLANLGDRNVSCG
ncbi:ATP-binding protein [Novosphingobium resinovorum]|uniref:ATP-binding protein n=1 Tax=Novosphingobium resinovorum TaxID=158500 RepID=UPI0012E9C77E|nr:ATP-binding protein [Novosphingobium resinovorum]